MTDDELCYLSASDCVARFRDGALAPPDLLEALIARIERHDGTINALTDRYFDDARAGAEAAAGRWRRGEARPLEGVPVLVKDCQRVKGRRTTHGSLIFMDAAPETVSDPMIERLEAAGAVILGRTAVPEFCLSGVCHSRAWGVTRNPFDPAYGPGGSSGGSAAALAAGFAPLATGTDIGGSIRIPAACCGVAGFKPPHGRNPDGPPANFDRYNHCGPLARSVADLALVQRVVAGAHPRDHDSLRDPPALPDAAASIEGLRVAWSIDLGFRPVDPAVRAATLAAVERFRALGAHVEEVSPGWTAAVDTAALHWANAMHFGRQTGWHAAGKAHLLTHYALAVAANLGRTTLDDAARSWETQHAMQQSFGAIMERFDVFLCPTNAVPAVAAEHDPAAPFEIDGVTVDGEFGWILTHPFNMLSNCPVMAVPSGRAPNGLPTGVQIVGRTFDDATVFRAALAYEQACGGFLARPEDRPRL